MPEQGKKTESAIDPSNPKPRIRNCQGESETLNPKPAVTESETRHLESETGMKILGSPVAVSPRLRGCHSSPLWIWAPYLRVLHRHTLGYYTATVTMSPTL